MGWGCAFVGVVAMVVFMVLAIVAVHFGLGGLLVFDFYNYRFIWKLSLKCDFKLDI